MARNELWQHNEPKDEFIRKVTRRIHHYQERIARLKQAIEVYKAAKRGDFIKFNEDLGGDDNV